MQRQVALQADTPQGKLSMGDILVNSGCRRLWPLLLAAATTGCARQYTTHLEPQCPAARAHTVLDADRSPPETVTGTVRDRDSGRPLAAARLQIEPGGLMASSDSVGGFIIGPLASGRYQLTVLRTGYERLAIDFDVVRGRGTRADIALVPASLDRCMEMTEVRTPRPWWHIW